MASQLRLPALILAALSIGLNVAIVGCAGQTLSVFMNQRYTTIWFMPIWSSHFDIRELWALIGTSAAIFVLNLVLMAALFVSSLPANFLVLTTSGLSTAVALIALIFSSVLNNQTSSSETLQSWTCRYRSLSNEGVPSNYNTLCHETRFAYYTAIPSFVLQLLLLVLSVYAVFASSKARGVRLDEEKSKSQHELSDVVRQQHSFDTKTDSPRSAPNSVRIMEGVDDQHKS